MTERAKKIHDTMVRRLGSEEAVKAFWAASGRRGGQKSSGGPLKGNPETARAMQLKSAAARRLKGADHGNR